MNLKKIGKVFTSKFVGTGPSSCEKRIYRAAVSQSVRNTALGDSEFLGLQSDLFSTEALCCLDCVGFVESSEEMKSSFTLTLRRLMSCIYGAPILDVSRSHTTTQHSR